MNLGKNVFWKQLCYINGEWVASSTNATLDVLNPYDDSLIGTVPMMSREETMQTIAAAKRAWPSWARMPACRRGEYLHRMAGLIREHVEELAVILTVEQGKPLEEAKVEILGSAAYFDWAAEEARRVYGETIPMCIPGKQAITIKQPVGVAAAITPWNFPFNLVSRKVAPALAAGCPIIVKPASVTPYTALSIAAIAEKAGIPAGILNVVTGSSSQIGAALMESPDVRALSFTGSTETGTSLLAQCARTVKKTAMELGGNAPFIVYDDADLDLAVTCAYDGKRRNSGQICVCPNRYFVHRKVYEPFLERLSELATSQNPGNGLDKDVNQGPLIDSKAVAQMEAFVQDATSKGARLVLGGKPIPDLGPNFFRFTILADVTPDMNVYREEIFGPIISVIPFETEEEVIRAANDTEYGLASYIFTNDIGKAWRTAHDIEYGLVGINEISLGITEIPFGGIKASGLGREGGSEGVLEYMETKALHLGNLGR